MNVMSRCVVACVSLVVACADTATPTPGDASPDTAVIDVTAADVGVTDVSVTSDRSVDGSATRCRRREDCASGFCEFAATGCATEGVCALPTACAEPRIYCGCDGVTFRGCSPDRPTLREGACAASDGGVGPRGCRTSTDCTGGQLCHFSAPGCGVMGMCLPPRDCAALAPYCGCDGMTFGDCPGGLATQPYRATGPCATGADGGAPDADSRCAGAHIGRSGRDCAGPADNPLALDCCTWNCDTNRALCESLPPMCAPGEVNTVVGACWGPCVPSRACMAIACGPMGACPAQWRCDAAMGRCVPR